MSKIDTISKLFAQAKGEEENGNVDAANSFMEKAMTLCSQYGIDEAEARGRMSQEEKANTLTMTHITIGEAGTVGLKEKANSIALILIDVLGVKCNLATNGSHITVYSTVEQSGRAKSLAASILEQLDTALIRGRKEYAKNPVKEMGRRVRFSSLSFIQGFFSALIGLARQVKNDRDSEFRQAEEKMASKAFHADSWGDVSRYNTALAVREMELEVADYYARHSSARRHMSLRRSRGGGFHQGVEEGKQANLSTHKALTV